jgi:hypothetical protein
MINLRQRKGGREGEMIFELICLLVWSGGLSSRVRSSILWATIEEMLPPRLVGVLHRGQAQGAIHAILRWWMAIGARDPDLLFILPDGET